MAIAKGGRVGRLILLHLTLIGIGSCGIPSTSFLPPVPVDKVFYPIPAETSYKFTIPDPSTINADIFDGFEIYYKFFRTPTVLEFIDENGDVALSDPASHIQLQNAGYARLAASTETPSDLPHYPLILLTDAEKDEIDLAIELDFSNYAGHLPTSLHGSIQLVRSLKGASGERLLKGFSPSHFTEADSDLPQGFNPSAESEITISLYVLSYGNNFSDFDFDIYSSAVYLGKTDLSLSIL